MLSYAFLFYTLLVTWHIQQLWRLPRIKEHYRRLPTRNELVEAEPGILEFGSIMFSRNDIIGHGATVRRQLGRSIYTYYTSVWRCSFGCRLACTRARLEGGPWPSRSTLAAPRSVDLRPRCLRAFVTRTFSNSSAAASRRHIRSAHRSVGTCATLIVPRPLRVLVWQGRMHLVMELMDASLQAHLDQISPLRLPRTSASHMALQIAQGLRHLHENQVCHRDLKPGNILPSF